MEQNASGAAAPDSAAPDPLPTSPDWEPFAAHLVALGQRVGMAADDPGAASGPHMRIMVCLEDAATRRVVTLPPALHHPLRPGPPERACIELLVPATERGHAALRGLRLTWSGRRAADVAPIWEGMCVEVHGRGTLEAAAGVLAAWARVFPDAVVRVSEVGRAKREAEEARALEGSLP